MQTLQRLHDEECQRHRDLLRETQRDLLQAQNQLKDAQKKAEESKKKGEEKGEEKGGVGKQNKCSRLRKIN